MSFMSPRICICTNCGRPNKRPLLTLALYLKVKITPIFSFCRNSETQIFTLTHVSIFSNSSEVELFAKKNPKQMLRRLEVFLKERRVGGMPCGISPDPQAQQPSPSLGERVARAGTAQGSKGKEMHFTGVCDLPPDMEGEARLI